MGRSWWTNFMRQCKSLMFLFFSFSFIICSHAIVHGDTQMLIDYLPTLIWVFGAQWSTFMCMLRWSLILVVDKRSWTCGHLLDIVGVNVKHIHTNSNFLQRILDHQITHDCSICRLTPHHDTYHWVTREVLKFLV